MKGEEGRQDIYFVRMVTKLLVILIFFTLLSVDVLSPFALSAKASEELNRSVLPPEDEGDHFPCSCEWWAFHTVLTLDTGAHWDAFMGFQYETQSTNRSNLTILILFFYCFNRDTGKTYDFNRLQNKRGNQSIPFFFKKNVIDLRYSNCTMKGLYPTYTAYFENENQSIALNISLNATSSFHWVAQDEANGYFPWGLGWARYGFIPRLNVAGTMTIDGRTSASQGVGYFEHAWGNFSYGVEKKSWKNLLEFIKTLHKTLPFLKWILQERTMNDRLKISTANHCGYDWGWGTFTNGWGLHFGFFHAFGGEVSLTPDGTTFWDFANISVNYTRFLYIPEIDTYSPLDFILTAHQGEKTLYLRLITTSDAYLELLNIYPRSRMSCGAGGLQTIGVLEGYFQNGGRNISLHGNCTFGIYRQFLAVRYRSVEVTRIHPPQGSGFRFEIDSHLLGANFCLELLRFPLRRVSVSIEFTPRHRPEKPPGQQYNGAMLFVGGNGPGNYTRIQDAVDQALDGDTVFVYSGNYRENIVVDKAIRLIGENKSTVLLHAGTQDGIKVRADNVEIAGFTIEAEQANSYDDAAIYLASSGNYVHDNILTRSDWYGIIVFNSSYNVIENNSIIDDDIGVWLCQARANTLCYNNISQSNHLGIWLWPFSEYNIISYNNIIGNKVSARDYDMTTPNLWSYNFWSDYRWRSLKPDHNNAGFIPYRISSLNCDYHPLLQPYHSKEMGN